MIDELKSKREEIGLSYWEKCRYDDLLEILDSHKFWENEPIQLMRYSTKEGEIKKIKPEDVPDECTPLPPGFEWDEFDINNDETNKEITDFLNSQFVGGPSGNLMITSTPEKFKWSLKTPTSNKYLHLLIRNSKNKKIMASITCDVKKFFINGKIVKMAETNFLCVHMKLRDKRLAAILVAEELRRTRKLGIPQCMYTSHHSKPSPICTIHYMLRFLNPSKLLETDFTRKADVSMSFKEFEKMHRIS
jgi:glycylpeptide N-tetradecanoyltransferase